MKKKDIKPQRSIAKRVFRFVLKSIVVLLLLFVLLVLFIRSPWGQNLIVDKATDYVSETIGTPFRIDKFYLTFQGNLAIDGLYLEDESQDTLLYAKELEIDIPILPIIRKQQIKLQNLQWSGLVAKVERTASSGKFNYQYIIDAFASEETTTDDSPAYTFDINQIHLSDFEITYTDEIEALDASLALGQLDLSFEKFDLDNFDFQLKNWYLSNTQFVYHQEKRETPQEELPSETKTTETANLPLFGWNTLVFENVNIDFEDENIDLKLNSNLSDFQMDEALINLNTSEFKLTRLALAESFVEIQLPASTSANSSAEQADTEFSWPAYFVQLDELTLENNRFQYLQGKQEIQAAVFDEKAMEISRLHLNLSDFLLEKEEKVSFQLNNLSLIESSGFEVEKLAFNVLLNSNEIDVNAFDFQTPRNKLVANAVLQYNQLGAWIQQPDGFQNLNLDLDASMDIAEFITLYPTLKEVAYFEEIAKHPIDLKVKSNGNLARLAVQQFNVKWASSQLTANGNFTQLKDTEKLTYQLNDYKFTTQKKDVLNFLELNPESFNLPETINLSGYANGNLENLNTESLLRLPEGDLKLFAELQQTKSIKLNTRIELVKMDVGKLINQPNLAPVSLSISAQAKGKDWLDLEGQLTSKFSELKYADFDASDLDFSGEIAGKNACINLGLDHKNLQFSTQADIELDSIQTKVDLVFNLKGADFEKLGFTPKKIRAKTNITAHFSGNEEDFEFNSSIDSTLVVYDTQSYEVGKFEINAVANKNQTDVSIDSKLLTTSLTANANPNELISALQNHYQNYLSNPKDFRETENPVEMNMQLRLYGRPIISEVLLEGIETLDSLTLDFNFNEKAHQLNADLQLPRLVYNKNDLQGLAVNIKSDRDKANFSFGFENLKAGIIEIDNTLLYGDFAEKELRLNFEAFKAGNEFFNIQSLFSFREDEMEFRLLPEHLILNEKPWQISANNFIKYQNTEGDKTLFFNEFELTRNAQYVGFRNDFDIDKSHAGIAFKDFKLSTLASYLNNQEDFAQGIVSGNLIVVKPFDKLGLISDLNIANLEVLQNPIGNLSLNANSDFDESYQFDLVLTGAEIQFTANGKIDNSSGTPYYNLDADLSKLEMQFVEHWAADYISDTQGKITAQFNLAGNQDDINYQGNFSFFDTQLRVKSLNALFKLGDEKIKFDNDAVQFKNFNVKDSRANALVLNGDIGITDLLNPSFNINAKATNFEALNSTKKDNEVYFGKVNFDADIQLLGDLNFPKVEGDIAFKETTDITYIVPQTQVGTVERDGVVVFVNKKNPDDILTRNEEERFNAVISGIEIKTLLKIHPKAKAKVVINSRTGDNVSLVGGGDLKLDVARNGNISLFGKYEVSNGQFELNFYNLVTRNFQIAKGSSVSWTGDPYNADLDIRTIYNIETSVSSLMASQTSSESPMVKNQFRQQLPFEVYLDVGGEINAPELNFQLDMPENERGAINGTVYNRITQINQQANELNKQVFSLLVLNRFYPDAGSDGSQGGANNIARSNINQALSDQLNTFANKLMGNTGIQLNFDVNSYTDFQSGQANNRTDVAISAQKKLLDDRLIVEAGSQVNVEGELRPGESNVALGNVSVQYLLTDDGQWKLKGFRRSEYENVIDGQVFISGIALIFTREFNHFKELWAKQVKEENEKLKAQKDEVKSSEDAPDEAPPEESKQQSKANLPEEK